MTIVRRIGFACIALLAIVVWFAMAPHSMTKSAHDAQLTFIEQTDDENNASTAGAPQQTVVNGWTANDYLKLISKQMTAEQDRRPAALLTLLLLAACLHYGTTAPSGVVVQRLVPRASAGVNGAVPVAAETVGHES